MTPDMKKPSRIVNANLCKDYLRFNRRHTYVNLEEVENVCASPEQMEILKEVLSLPARWKTVLLLHYVEGYQIKEISHITGLSESAVKKRLQRGREALKRKLSNLDL